MTFGVVRRELEAVFAFAEAEIAAGAVFRFAREDSRAHQEYADLPEEASVRVYSLAEMAAEKVVALMDRARNEPRDLYDLWYLETHGDVRLSDLVGAIEQKLLCGRCW